MGFLNGFLQEIKDNHDNKEIIDMYHDMNVLDSDYRSIAFENSSSNYGWYTCPKCGRKFRKTDMDADHIIPQSRGGSNSRHNLQLLCAHCNRSKGADTSETLSDLNRRRKELKQQDKDDLKFLNDLSKQIRR